MYEIPESMKDELGEWNDGTGIDLESWVGCEGNFGLAAAYASLLWPRFVTVGKYILLERVRPWVSAYDRDDGIPPKQVEYGLNRIHLDNLQHVGCADISADKLILIGNILKEMYEAKLNWQFPDQPCIVEFNIPEDPEDFREYQITFWQKAFDD